MTALGGQAAAVWTMPETWPIPQEWSADDVCFVICSGESVGPQAETIARLQGRFIAVKHGVFLRPNADVLFLSGDGGGEGSKPLLDRFTGTYAIVRSKHHPDLPASVKRVTRSKQHEQLCDLRDHVCGYDSGTSAINVAYHFGARTIVMLGYDMTGGHFCKHPLQRPPQDHFRRHMGPLARLNDDARRKGVRIVNCSPISAVTAFERQPLEAFL